MNEVYQMVNCEQRTALDRIKYLESLGYLTPVHSYEEYERLIGEAKSNSKNPIFSNCYLLKEEVEKLIEHSSLFQIMTSNGTAFVSDENFYWKLLLFVDPNEPFSMPRLDKSVLMEVMYRGNNPSDQEKEFISRVCAIGFRYYETYQKIDCVPQMSREQFLRRYNIALRALEQEGASICSPDDNLLVQFEEIYIQEMEIYVRHYYSLEERRIQRDKGLLNCVINSRGDVLAIGIAPQIHGGVTAVRRDYSSNIYAPALLLHGLQPYYSEPGFLRPKHNYGWIAKSNVASNRLHDLMGMKKIERFFSQYVMPGILY